AVKEQSCCTPSIFSVNEKCVPVSTRIFNRVHAVHRPMTGFGANPQPISGAARARRGVALSVLI
ncbi:MAG: hypothetical protein ACLPHP_07695, partial [Candidatus Sulfotelmatobacter sp.]